MRHWTSRFGQAFLLWDTPLGAGILAASVYLWFALRPDLPGVRVSSHPYYNYLADAFLHGQLHLRVLPPSAHDLTEVAGRYYLYWPPMPAIILMPLISIWGLNFSDVLFTIAIGAVNVGLVARLLRGATARRVARLDRSGRAILVVCFALGSVHLFLATRGRVWFTGQLVGLLFVLLAYIAALRDAGKLSTWAMFGSAMAASLASRYHLVACGLWPLVMLMRYAPPRLRLLGPLAAALPVLLTVALLLFYNEARFGNPFDTGVSRVRVASQLALRMERYGQFHTSYLADNFYNAFILYPFPNRVQQGLGGGFFLLSPLFLAAFLTWGRPSASIGLLWLTSAMAALPGLLILGGGWYQFGPRYSMDYITPFLLLTATGMRRLPTPISAYLALISCVHFAIGIVSIRI